MTKSKKLEKKSTPAKKTNKKIVKADSKSETKLKSTSSKTAAPKSTQAKVATKESKSKAAASSTAQSKKSKAPAKTKSATKVTTKKVGTTKTPGKLNVAKETSRDLSKDVSNEGTKAKATSKPSVSKNPAKEAGRELAHKSTTEGAASVKATTKTKSFGPTDSDIKKDVQSLSKEKPSVEKLDKDEADDKKNSKKTKIAKKSGREEIELPPELDDDDGFGGGDDFADFEEPVVPRKVKPSVLDDTDSAEIILTDAEGRALCKVPNCDQRSNVEGYCRYHYLLFWKRIQVRKRILSEGKLEKYIEELTSRYPMKYLEMLKKDLRSIQDFLSAIQELEIDDSSSENEFEDEAQTFIDEVRGISSTEGDSDEEF